MISFNALLLTDGNHLVELTELDHTHSVSHEETQQEPSMDYSPFSASMDDDPAMDDCSSADTNSCMSVETEPMEPDQYSPEYVERLNKFHQVNPNPVYGVIQSPKPRRKLNIKLPVDSSRAKETRARVNKSGLDSLGTEWTTERTRRSLRLATKKSAKDKKLTQER